MEESRKVYGWLALLSFALLALSAFAGQRVVVSQMPEPVRTLAEVETNVVFSTGVATDNKWTLTIERERREDCRRFIVHFLCPFVVHISCSDFFCRMGYRLKAEFAQAHVD